MDQQLLINRIVKTFLIINLVILDGVVVYLVYKSEFLISKSQTNSNVPIIQNVDQCGEDCRLYIDSKMVKALPTSSPTPTPTPRVVYQTAPKTKTRTISYVTVPGSGSTTASDWTILSGSDFYFNPADYPGLVEVYFEANMKLVTGSGRAYARLYDSTHGIGAQGSEASTQAGTDTVVESGKISFWQGKNLIKVQIKSLTTESAVYNSGRLRITTEN